MFAANLVTHVAVLALLGGHASISLQVEPGQSTSEQGSQVVHVSDGVVGEVSLAKLMRVAMNDPQESVSWTGLSAGLARFGERSGYDVDASVLAAREIADSVGRGTSSRITGIRVVSQDGMTRVGFGVSGAVTTLTERLFWNPARPRVYVDIHGAELDISGAPFTGIDRGGVRQIRGATRPNGDVRLVLDLERQAEHTVRVENGVVWVDLNTSSPSFEEWSVGVLFDASPAIETVRVTPPGRAANVRAVVAPVVVPGAVPGSLVEPKTTSPAGLESGGSDQPPGATLQQIVVFRVQGWLSQGRRAAAPVVTSLRSSGWMAPTVAAFFLLLVLIFPGRKSAGTAELPSVSDQPDTPFAGGPVSGARRLLEAGQSPREVAGRLGIAIDMIPLLDRGPTSVQD